MRQNTNVPDGHWHTCQYAKSLSVFSHFKCYPLPSPVQRNSSDLGDSHKWPWSGWGGPDPWTPPPSAAPVVFVVYQCVLDWVSFPWSHCNTYIIFPHSSCNSLWCQFIFYLYCFIFTITTSGHLTDGYCCLSFFFCTVFKSSWRFTFLKDHSGAEAEAAAHCNADVHILQLNIGCD